MFKGLFAATWALLATSALAYDSTFVLDVAERYVKLCGASYCTDPKLRKNCVDTWSCNVCSNFPNMTAKSFKSAKNDGNGYVGYDAAANEIVVAFSGTDPLSIRNWLDDLNFFKTKYPYCDGCEVHEGFYNTYLSVHDDVKGFVSAYQQQYPTATLAITGHSLGAAMAAHCAAEFTYLGQKISTVYSYGMPRVGNEAFEQWYKNTVAGTFRVVHRKDPVPHLAPESFGFHHMPYEVRLFSTCTSLCCGDLHRLSDTSSIKVYREHSVPNSFSGTLLALPRTLYISCRCPPVYLPVNQQVFYTKDYHEWQLCSYEGEDKACSDQYAADLDVGKHTHIV